MKQFLIILLLILNVYADTNSTYESALQKLKSITDQNTTENFLKMGSAYIKKINTQANRDKAVELYKNSTQKVSDLAVQGLIEIYCSKEATQEDKYKCIYWSSIAKKEAVNIKKLQQVTYKLNIKTIDDKEGTATAVALSSDGKLITAYHNIDSAKNIVAVDNKGNKYNATIGKISESNDLAYIYIDAIDISFANLSMQEEKLANDVYILNNENLLLKGILSKIEKSGIVINVEISKGTSGAGVFNSHNELVAIALSKDRLDNTSFAASVNILRDIKDNYVQKKELLKGSNNYDYSYCENKDDLAIWNKNAKSDSLAIQEFHALFLGLCQKVKNRDLTTEEAQIIFEESRKRLID